jgi:hypothetical protein
VVFLMRGNVIVTFATQNNLGSVETNALQLVRYLEAKDSDIEEAFT